MSQRSQIDVPDWNYSCTNCGKCCRHWHVELGSGEAVRLAGLEWTPADQISEPRTVRVDARTCVAHQPNGDCIYLDAAARRCRIHARFGARAKPYGCRLYPFSILPTTAGRFSCLCRLDCPAARARHGRPLRQSLPEIAELAGELGRVPPLDPETLGGLHPEKAREIVAAFCREVLEHPRLTAGGRLVVAVAAVARLEGLGSVFLNDVDLGEILPKLFRRVIEDCQHLPLRDPGRFEQWRFLSLWSAYLRRDEESLTRGLGGRWRRARANLRLYLGQVSLRDLGAEHPAGALAARTLFTAPVAAGDEALWALPLAVVRLRLESLQFMGRVLFNLTFFTGLKALFLTFPLVVATAKWQALLRGETPVRLTLADVDYAVGAIDHSFGWSPLLGLGLYTVITRQMTEREAFARLLYALQRPPAS